MEEFKTFRPYGDDELSETSKLVECLMDGWRVVVAFGGDRSVVIVSKTTLGRKSN